MKTHAYRVHFCVCLEGGVGVEDKQPNTTNMPIWIHWWCSGCREPAEDHQWAHMGMLVFWWGGKCSQTRKRIPYRMCFRVSLDSWDGKHHQHAQMGMLVER